jgi:hypothetical protein
MLFLLAMISTLFFSKSNAQGRQINSDAANIKNELLILARSYAGQGDADGSKQKNLEAIIAKLLKANPQPPVKDRLPLIFGAWKQEWGPYDYRKNKRGVDPELGISEIYQVVFKDGFYYNVSPNYKKGDKNRESIVLLRGEYRLDPKNENALLVKFTSLRGLNSRPTDGNQLYDLPALTENKKLKDVKNVIPSFLVKLFFGGGALKEVYTDQDMRILYGASSNKFKDQYLYVMTRVGK